MASRWRGGLAYVTVDDDGRVLQVAGPPTDNDGNTMEVVLAGFGRRVVAFPSYLQDASDPAFTVYWESLDGGVNWDRLAMPQALVREYIRGGGLTVACAFAGCVIGDTVARVGWGGADTGTTERPADAAPAGTPGVLTPIVCDLAPAGRWSRIEDIHLAGSPVPLPAVQELMRGRSVWSALSMDRATGALTTTSATLGESGEGEARVIRRPLAGPRAPHTAQAVSATQIEGYAVVRAPFAVDPKGQVKVGAPMKNVEVAWENFFEGTSNRGRIPDAGVVERNDVILIPSGIDALKTSLISISSRGFFVRPHASHAKGAEELFVDPSGRSERYTPAPWPQSGALGPLEFRGDASSLGGELLGVGLLLDSDREWSSVVLAKRAPAGAWGYTAESLLPSRGAATTLNMITTWAFSAKTPVGALTLLDDPTRSRAWSFFIGFKSDGTFQPAQPVPTLFDLGERPRPCSAADRAGTPRAIMPFRSGARVILFPGMRHPVLVQEPRPKNAVGVAEPLVFLTGSAVVHGTPASPCLAAFHAESATNSPMSAVLPGDLARSWLFRYTYDAPRAAGKRDGGVTPTLEYRPMACHYDANARIPESVWAADGTTHP
jgi:hypothetical protein